MGDDESDDENENNTDADADADVALLTTVTKKAGTVTGGAAGGVVTGSFSIRDGKSSSGGKISGSGTRKKAASSNMTPGPVLMQFQHQHQHEQELQRMHHTTNSMTTRTMPNNGGDPPQVQYPTT